ncbi:MAG: DUF4912 domain-containing protein [Nitrospirae bacterium]|nr:DUF4912 domain-containing protein [Nitrospirota bacterium]
MEKKKLEEKTVAELKAIAKKAGITLKAGARKAELISEIIKSSKKKPKAIKAKKPLPKVKPIKPKKVVKPKKAVKQKVKEKPVKVRGKPLPPKGEIKREVIKPIKPAPKETAMMVFPALPIRDFSTEYSMDTVIALTLEPRKVFIYWEVTENTFKKLDGELVLRVYDVTGIATPADAISYFDISIQRIGSVYIEVMPEREFIMETGIFKKKVFSRISRSNRVSTPLAMPFKKGPPPALPEKYYEVVGGGLGS